MCFKASWIINVLHTGFGFPEDYDDLQPVERLKDIEVQWSLGALIYYMTQYVHFFVPLGLCYLYVCFFSSVSTGHILWTSQR
ncbi:unnamed protein product [Dibothriocephalus latus]|uniref:Uncharacterized protein n=1 Tax=Dibothriocephalus latus TaxID=60516 RepID=A0A3P7RJE5_DIBLA|nr:unnamed protein product [Dibothriocephalus latus]